MESQYIFNDGGQKSRLRKDGFTPQGEQWYVAEYKKSDDDKAEWFPWICGTASFLALTEQDKAWAK